MISGSYLSHLAGLSAPYEDMHHSSTYMTHLCEVFLSKC